MPMDRERGSLARRHPDNRITFDLAAIMRTAHCRAGFTMRSALALDRRRQAMSFALKAVWREAKIEAVFHRQMIERDAYVARDLAARAAAHVATAARYGNDAKSDVFPIIFVEQINPPQRYMVPSNKVERVDRFHSVAVIQPSASVPNAMKAAAGVGRRRKRKGGAA